MLGNQSERHKKMLKVDSSSQENRKRSMKDLNTVSLDFATQTGWATNIGGNRFGTMTFDLKRGESPGMRFLRCRKWLEDLRELLGEKIELIVYEQSIHNRFAATIIIVGLISEMLAFAAIHNIETLPVYPSTLKKRSTGNGRASKDDMIAEAKKRGYNVDNDDEADAVLLLLGVDYW